jgi:hypothetical protein
LRAGRRVGQAAHAMHADLQQPQSRT